MTAEIIAVGTELLMGQTLNTNARLISEKLTELGISVMYHSVVGDNRGRLRSLTEQAKERSDVLVFTGGLGPTDDDLTKETVAAVFHKELSLHEPSLAAMKAYVKAWDKGMPKNNVKQAFLPKDGIVIPNHNGTAPGCIMEDGGKTAVLLPGPPSEMKPMLLESVLPYLRLKSDCSLYSRVLRVFGIGESAAALMVDDLIKNQTNPTIAPYAKEGEVTFRVTAMAKSAEEANELMRPTVDRLKHEFGDCLYAEGEEASMAKTVIELLTKKGKALATAESCTGGLIGRELTSVAGASRVYGFGFVTYANEAKEKLLGVKRETLKAHGAVSAETAVEMAIGALSASGADIAVSVTGIAGPDGGTPEKPVGLVYVGIATAYRARAVRLNLSGDRERVRVRACLNALDLVRRELLE